jgi:hypothetical protein
LFLVQGRVSVDTYKVHKSGIMAIKRKNSSWAIDLEFYKKLREVVKAGTFKSISFSPWHKGCDTDLEATCEWPELKGLMETWYYEIIGEIEIHNYANVTAEFSGDKLTFDVFTALDHCADYPLDIKQAWDEEEFQGLIFDLLPKRLQEQTHSLDLMISLEIEYENSEKSTMSNFEIWLMDGEVDGDLAGSITPDGLRVIKEYIAEWCLGYFSPDSDFSVVMVENRISSFSTYALETFLMIPDPPEIEPEREPENFNDLTTTRPPR